MTIEKVISYDQSIDEAGLINVRQITRLMEDGVELSKTYHRHVIDPATADLTNEDPRTILIATALKDAIVV